MPVNALAANKWVEGHGQSLGLLGVKEAILKGLLVGQGLDVIPGHVGPVVNSS